MNLIIGNKNITNIKDKYVRVSSHTINGEQFYTLLLEVTFIYNNKDGYLSLLIGTEKENDINSFSNKIYNDPDDAMLEIFDTDEFIDLTYDEKVSLKTGNIKDNKLQVLLISKSDECIIEYEDELRIKAKKYDANNLC